MKDKKLVSKAAQIRLAALQTIHKSACGFLGGSMSLVEILVALYYGELNNEPVMNFNPNNPGWEAQDYLYLSKGHASPVLYAILADLGFFEDSELDYFAKFNSLLTPRPNKKIPGVSATNLIYGDSFSMALGSALALKMDKKENKTFCLLGDSELQIGKTWETAMLASHHNLRNLVLVIDNNGFQDSGSLRSVVDIGSILGKFDSFGWKVVQVRDGHDFSQILEGIYKSYSTIAKPVCLWCHTIKGKGVPFAEGNEVYHGASISDAELNEIKPKLEKIWKEL